MNEPKKTEMDTLTQIWQVCRSHALSKDAKLAFVMLVAPSPTITNVINSYADPPEDVKDGLCELARKGLIRLEIDGYIFKAQVDQIPPTLFRV